MKLHEFDIVIMNLADFVKVRVAEKDVMLSDSEKDKLLKKIRKLVLSDKYLDLEKETEWQKNN